MNNRKFGYLFDCISRYWTDKSCPYCNAQSPKVIDRKYYFARLLQCQNCHLNFRHPLDSEEINRAFYQKKYVENGIVSNVPTAEELEEYKLNSFRNSGKNYSDKIKLIELLTAPANPLKIVDYGSSWGYVSYQFEQKGFKTQSFEISKPSASLGKKLLGLDIKTEITEIQPENDVFFSAHVIEHLPDIAKFVRTAQHLLKPKGLMITFCPNGSDAFRSKHPDAFHSVWGMVHPNYLSANFFQYVFRDYPYLITSSPHEVELVKTWNKKDQIVGQVDGDELLAIAVLN